MYAMNLIDKLYAFEVTENLSLKAELAPTFQTQGCLL